MKTRHSKDPDRPTLFTNIPVGSPSSDILFKAGASPNLNRLEVLSQRILSLFIYSDEGPGLMRVRRTHRQHQRRHVYATQPVRAVTTRPQATTVPWQRVRSNSDEGPRLYRGNMPQERPARIYTDKEITAAGGNVPQGPVEGAKPRVFTGGNIGTTSLGPRPPSAHINQARNEHYDPALEVNLPSADQEQWSRRPGTPY